MHCHEFIDIQSAKMDLFIKSKIVQFNRQSIDQKPRAFSLYCRNSEGDIIGSELHIEYAKKAKKNSRKFSFLESFSFQTPGFYKNLGYKELGRLEGYANKHDHLFLYNKLI